MIGNEQRREETIGRDGFSHAWYVYTGKIFKVCTLSGKYKAIRLNREY